jgi:biotin carboxyl carrier protein
VQYEVEINGRTRHVVVHRAQTGLTVVVDGRSWQVDMARVDAHMLSLLIGDGAGADVVSAVRPPAAGRSYEIVVTPEPNGQLSVRVGTLVLAVSLNGRRGWVRKEDGGQAGSGPQRVVAPMPGKILRVLVKSGETVGARQPLVVVEAMKMENELRAGRDGTIAEMHAREGMSVEAGTLLVVIQ